jgi:hemerythrin
MPSLDWRDSYRTHVPEIDADHKKLFALAGSLDRAVREGRGAAAVRPALLELLEYTRSHFATEERMMEAARFPGLEGHRREHEGFVSSLRRRIELPAAVIAKDLAQMVANWLIDHVVRTDRDYVPYLLRKPSVAMPIPAIPKRR